MLSLPATESAISGCRSRRLILGIPEHRKKAGTDTAGLPNHESVSRRAEIDSDLAEHAQCRGLDGWTPKQITRERLRRLVGGMAADLSWRNELVTGNCQTRALVRVSVLSLTSVAAVTLAMFHFAFAAYMLGNTTIAEQRYLGGLDNYAEEVGRPIASVIAAQQ